MINDCVVKISDDSISIDNKNYYSSVSINKDDDYVVIIAENAIHKIYKQDLIDWLNK